MGQTPRFSEKILKDENFIVVGGLGVKPLVFRNKFPKEH